MNALGIAVVACAIQVTIFALAGGAVYLATFRRDPERAARTVLASMVGVALLTAVCWSPWPNWSNVLERELVSSDAHVEDAAAAADRRVPVSTAVTGGEPSLAASPDDLSASSTTIRSMWDGLRQVWSGEIGPQPVARWSWPAVFAAAFLSAAAFGLGRLVVGLIGVAHLRRGCEPIADPRLAELVEVLRAELGCTRNVTLVECRPLATAATIGWRQPLVLLPGRWRAWNSAELRAVLAHEIAHVSRGDFAAQFVSQVGLALHSYHPLVHWIAGRLRLEQELAADAVAARVAGGRQSYLTTLAGLALAQPAARLAWPVQAFIPSRHMFLRRIEMLRDQKAVGTGSAAAKLRERIVGWLAVAALCGVGLSVIGLRAPSSAHAENQEAGAESVEKPATAKSDKTEYDFSYVPENTMALVAIRQAELAADPRLRPLADLLDENTQPALPSKLVEQATLALVAPDLDEQGRPRVGFSPEQIVIHTKEPVDFTAYLKKGYPNLTEVPDGGYGILVTDSSPGAMSFFMPDKQTLLGRVRSDLVKLLANRNAALPPRISEKWQSDAKGPILVVVQSGPMGTVFTGRTDPITSLTSLLGPLLKGSDTLTLSLEPQEELRIVGRLACKTPDDAKRATETLNALAVIAQNAADTQRERIPQNSPDAAAATAFNLIDKCLASRKITTNGSDVQIETTIGKTDESVRMIVETLATAVKAARAAQRQTSMDNLKQIALRMLIYHDAQKHFPPAVLMGPDGKTPHSWRVALLPYMGHDALYKQYHLDQPWDSADNRKVLEQMPIVYRHPMDESGSFSTSYFVLTGPDTAFSDVPGKGTSFAEIRDGTSKTLMAVEAKRHTPWTKPEDISYAADGPLPKLGGWSANAFNAAFADGSVRPIADNVDEKLLRGMISKAGGETIDGQ